MRIARQGMVAAGSIVTAMLRVPVRMQDCRPRCVSCASAERFHCNQDRIALWGDSSSSHTAVLMAGVHWQSTRLIRIPLALSLLRCSIGTDRLLDFTADALLIC